MVAAENSSVNESDPEKMMKEFTETSDMDEDDMLKNRPHNLHKDENLNEEDFETTETVNMTETGDVELDESEVIDDNLMKLWCSQAVEVN